MKKPLSYLYCAALFAFTFVASSARGAVIQESFVVDTSSLAGVAGGIDMAFNPGVILQTQPATATVTTFGGASLDPANPASTVGNVTGVLPGTLQFGNSKAYNDVFTPVTFGSSFHFLLALDGPAVNTPDPAAIYGSVFTLGLFSTDGNTPRITADGIIATVDLVAGRATAVPHTFPATGSIVSVTSPVPEPATFALIPLALLLAAFCKLFIQRIQPTT